MTKQELANYLESTGYIKEDRSWPEYQSSNIVDFLGFGYRDELKYDHYYNTINGHRVTWGRYELRPRCAYVQDKYSIRDYHEHTWRNEGSPIKYSDYEVKAGKLCKVEK